MGKEKLAVAEDGASDVPSDDIEGLYEVETTPVPFQMAGASGDIPVIILDLGDGRPESGPRKLSSAEVSEELRPFYELAEEVFTAEDMPFELSPEDLEFMEILPHAIAQPEEAPYLPAHIQIIEHPARQDFTAEDIQLIAVVRHLGRGLIDKAKENLLANPAFKPATDELPEITGAGYDLFRSRNWQKARADRSYVDWGTIAQSPDVISPKNIKDWPNGEYLNCLGVSIAMAAACEIAGLRYFYVNELRSANQVIAEYHQDFLNNLNRATGDFFQQPEVINIYHTLDASNAPFRERGDDLFFNIPHTLEPKATPRDFHHSILADHPEITWLHLDPYGLVYSGANSGRAHLRSLFEFSSSPENITNVANVDTSANIRDFCRLYKQALHYLHGSAFANIASRLEDEKAYKSDNLFKHLMNTLYKTTRQMISLVYEAGILAADGDYSHFIAGITLDRMLVAFYCDMTGNNQAEVTYGKLMNRFFEHKSDEKEVIKARNELLERIEKEVLKIIRDDTSAREKFYKYFKALPYVILTNEYRYFLLNIFSLNTFGTPDFAAEYADPEFMIGAMYLNHYATWRKSGRINIARYLAEICPSQLLWQASLQDGEEPSKRAEAIGEVIAKLKPSQLHPFVYIARHARTLFR